jgi:hypothetical protein
MRIFGADDSDHALDVRRRIIDADHGIVKTP